MKETDTDRQQADGQTLTDSQTVQTGNPESGCCEMCQCLEGSPAKKVYGFQRSKLNCVGRIRTRRATVATTSEELHQRRLGSSRWCFCHASPVSLALFAATDV